MTDDFYETVLFAVACAFMTLFGLWIGWQLGNVVNWLVGAG